MISLEVESFQKVGQEKCWGLSRWRTVTRTAWKTLFYHDTTQASRFYILVFYVHTFPRNFRTSCLFPDKLIRVYYIIFFIKHWKRIWKICYSRYYFNFLSDVTMQRELTVGNKCCCTAHYSIKDYLITNQSKNILLKAHNLLTFMPNNNWQLIWSFISMLYSLIFFNLLKYNQKSKTMHSMPTILCQIFYFLYFVH